MEDIPVVSRLNKVAYSRGSDVRESDEFNQYDSEDGSYDQWWIYDCKNEFSLETMARRVSLRKLESGSGIQI